MDKREYDQPEPSEETRGKAIAYLVLGGVVVLLLILVSTGVVEVF
jgi:hypothetical protein